MTGTHHNRSVEAIDLAVGLGDRESWSRAYHRVGCDCCKQSPDNLQSDLSQQIGLHLVLQEPIIHKRYHGPHLGYCSSWYGPGQLSVLVCLDNHVLKVQT